MTMHNSVPLPLAIRVFPEAKSQKKTKSVQQSYRPESMLVFDTETTVDAMQKLVFGCYRFIDQGECREEGLFYDEDLPEDKLEILRRYIRQHKADTADELELKLISCREFLKKLFKAAYKVRSLVVGFNLPFDLSRLGFDVSAARQEFVGGFSLGLWTYEDQSGQERLDPNRPRVTVKHIDSKRALMSFTGRKTTDHDDLIPDDSADGKPRKGYKFRGHFLDLKTLAFALTDRGHSLKSGCEAFGVKRGKMEVSEHGKLTEEYIHYNRRDVEATAQLAQKLTQEFDRHPISLQETKAFSPASIGKAYLRAMGITPILQRQQNFQPYVGYAQTAYFGGRTSAHVRKVAVPVVYTDFLSMYPTVNSLMNLWPFVIAKEIRFVDHCHQEIIQFLEQLTEDSLFKPETWKQLTAFVRVVPDGDILPTRGQYSDVSKDWQVAVNYLHANTPDDSLWFALPDVVASVILTGKIPKIIDAFRIEPSKELLDGLTPIKLRGQITIDPRKQDFFKVVIEERKRVDSSTHLAAQEKKQLSKFLKVLANSTSYGIYGQMDRRETPDKVEVKCHGIDEHPYFCNVLNPEVPGEFCFSPLASLITSAARLMLALLEQSVTRLGGTYAMEDTDSMAIVATERGGLVPCSGGPLKLKNGSQAIYALSWAQIREIVKRFEALNPYDRDAVRGSVLKIEDCNFDPKAKKQRKIWCIAISAKRYVLFTKEKSNNPSLLRRGVNSEENHWSEHGLGHLLNPIDLESEDREWIAQIWHSIICNCLGVPSPKINFERVPAIGRLTVTSPKILEPFSSLNFGKNYQDQIKPFNFLLTCHVSPFGHPLSANPEKFHLIAPYEQDPREWLRMKWIAQYSGMKFGITTQNNYSSRSTARVKTYGDVAVDYEHHPESKCADEFGDVCDKQTKGLLYRRHVRIGEFICIGKESNKLEEVDAGLMHSADSVYTTYPDPRRDSWTRDVVPKLRAIPLSVLMRETGLSRRMLIKTRRGQVRPHSRNQVLLARAVRKTLVGRSLSFDSAKSVRHGRS
ncbi:DNA polymerase [Edaphobacter bradus]|uniref:DNA polymerase n=1 Tax=Edaphobacter bradus TaxID=2259016 RepID=UPI0021E00949|nr:DNA polymerase [Edaphobacter bradus]